MRKLLYLILCMPIMLLTTCDVHEFPEAPEIVNMQLRLNYKTEMTEWHHKYNGTTVIEQGSGAVYDNVLECGQIRYIVRTYPTRANTQQYTQEFIITKEITEDYNHVLSLDILPGSYNVMVWSDLVSGSDDEYFYDPQNFAEVKLQGEYQGNTDYRDAYIGNADVTVVSDILDRAPDTLDITMQRAVAKYEFITNDLKNFIDKEIEYLTKAAETRGEIAPTSINTAEYNVVLYFSGYMPSAYNINSDKPIDAKMGVMFKSKLNVLSENEASLGFDYVFANDNKSAVSIQLGLYNKEERQVALTDPINVPLRRSHHTILRGSFLMQQASGGIAINPDFDGNHNVVIK